MCEKFIRHAVKGRTKMYIYYLVTNNICTFFVIKFGMNIIHIYVIKKFWEKKKRSGSKIYL